MNEILFYTLSIPALVVAACWSSGAEARAEERAKMGELERRADDDNRRAERARNSGPFFAGLAGAVLIVGCWLAFVTQ